MKAPELQVARERTTKPKIERISIELTDRCTKACSFCYNKSNPQGRLQWATDELLRFVEDCATNGTEAVSFGGGEPLQHPDVFQIFRALEGKLFRSMTTNGLLLDEHMDALVAGRPDKVHISIHFPNNTAEVERVVRQVDALAARGIRSGVNLLVARSNLEAAASAGQILRAAGIGNERIVYLPMRGADTPTPQEVAVVAGSQAFQSMSCLSKCAASPRFVSIAADKSVGFCSYTSARAKLSEPSFSAFLEALNGLGLTFCGGTDG